MTTSAAPRFTFSRATRYRVYGAARRRLASVGATSSSALRSTGAAACGFFAATAENGANSRPISAAYCARLWPSRARRAFSNVA